ncbi:hypothetical protein ABPH35_00580 [Streptococcus sp. ZJ93]|uniref:hypothetical protein n=1 Tax=Streptococcus handemini TaxID=3161188 RepID=UPI0034D75CD7
MKKSIIWLSVTCLFLVACGKSKATAPSSTAMSHKKVAQSSSTSSSKKVEPAKKEVATPKVNNNEMYRAAIDAFAQKHGQSLPSGYFSYAYYDIDKNGQDELLIGNKNSNDYFLYGIYYNQQGTVEPVVEGIVEIGPINTSIRVFPDGRISSTGWGRGMGDGDMIVYQLRKDNSGVDKGAPVSFKQLEFPWAELGLNPDEALTFLDLEWTTYDVNGQ